MKLWTYLLRLLGSLIPDSFFGSGFTFETPKKRGDIDGWLSRDPYNDEWILWSTRTKQMYRKRNWNDALWRPSPETKHQCMKLGRVRCEMLGERFS
jgi:hypothetical protein